MLGGESAVMTTLDAVTKKKQVKQSAEQQAAAELVRLAQEQGLSLTGPDGLLKQLTKTVLETALNEEMTEHLGYEKHDPPGAGTGNIRNGTRAKTVLTDTTGPMELDVPRDRAASILGQALQVLEQLGYPRDGEAGVPFDPERHEVVGVVEQGDSAPGTVVEVLRPGYGQGSSQLRPAAVVVSRREE
jgi:hypothetical protein